jgi:uncharacterized protein YgbK (DUF1537 family)
MPFAVGSSGLNYALCAHWHAAGRFEPAHIPDVPPVETLLVVSGSCAPVTGRQIAQAVEDGFVDIPLDTPGLAQGRTPDKQIQKAVAALSQGRSVICHLAQGPDDARIQQTVEAMTDAADEQCGSRLGRVLAEILIEIARQTTLPRFVVTGGDTSGYVARALGIEALEMIGPLAPGSPLCRAHATNDKFNGCEVVFKGGQVGWPDFFRSVLTGQTHQNT